jgi:hypothetical protein
MVAALMNANEKPSKTEKIYTKSYIDELKEAFNKENDAVSCLKVSDGMLIVLVRNMERKLSNRLLSTKTLKDTEKLGLEEHVLSIMDFNSDNNGLLFGTIHYHKEKGINNTQGTKPLFWSQLPLDHIKKYTLVKWRCLPCTTHCTYGENWKKKDSSQNTMMTLKKSVGS